MSIPGTAEIASGTPITIGLMCEPTCFPTGCPYKQQASDKSVPSLAAKLSDAGSSKL